MCKGGAPFQGECNDCCEKLRRLSQCPKLDAKLAAKGKGRNPKGKGKEKECKGGKPLAYAGVDTGQQQPVEQQAASAAPPAAHLAEEEWWIGVAYNLTTDPRSVPSLPLPRYTRQRKQVVPLTILIFPLFRHG